MVTDANPQEGIAGRIRLLGYSTRIVAHVLGVKPARRAGERHVPPE